MITKYSVYDAKTGGTTICDTKEEAIKLFWNNVIFFAKSHFHNTSYIVIEQNDDGTEKWYNDNNQEIDITKTINEINDLLS